MKVEETNYWRFMFNIEMFKTEPTRWKYELPSDWKDLPDLFHYFGVSEVSILIDANFTRFVLENSTFVVENRAFGHPLWIAAEVVGMLNHLHFSNSECVYYFYLYRGYDTAITVEKTSMGVFIEEKPPFSLGRGQWELMFKAPIDMNVGIGDLPECQLLF
jgi:hypothetical protein